MHQPQIVQRIQNEIDNVVGRGKLPELDDRIQYEFQYFVNHFNFSLNFSSLPYTEATLRETMRFDTLVPSSVPHKALVDTHYMGYDIPKVRNL